jgi:uncharacterized membrane protein YcaP (DUF421 family)
MEQVQSWLSQPDRLLHIFISCVVFYVFIVALTRVSGKRTTANMNNFDWIINVSIGSTMASGILLNNVSMIDAMFAVAILAGVQYLTTWGTVRSSRFARLVKPDPRPLLRSGNVLEAELKRERITEAELRSAIRRAGLVRFDAAEWVVLETDGQFSVIQRKEHASAPAELMDGVIPARSAPADMAEKDGGQQAGRDA